MRVSAHHAGPAEVALHAEMVRVRPPRGWPSLDLAEVWAYRELALFLAWRDVKVRYKQATLGILWIVGQPLVTMVMFTLLFGRVAKLPSDGVPYPIFTLTGLLVWQLFSSAVTGASTSLVGNASLLTKVYFPRLIIPIAAVCSALVDFGVTLLMAIVLLAWYRVTPGPAILVLPLFVALAVVAALAVGLWTSALNVEYRDVQFVIPFAMQVWLFASPVAYSDRIVPDGMWRTLYELNPVVGIVRGFRWALVGTGPPGASIGVSVVLTLVVLVGGVHYFRWMEQRFADVI